MNLKKARESSIVNMMLNLLININLKKARDSSIVKMMLNVLIKKMKIVVS
jgi:hypothetical protein